MAVLLAVAGDELLDAGGHLAAAGAGVGQQLRVQPGDLAELAVRAELEPQAEPVGDALLERAVVGGGDRLLERPRGFPVEGADPPVADPDAVQDTEVGVQVRFAGAARVVLERDRSQPLGLDVLAALLGLPEPGVGHVLLGVPERHLHCLVVGAADVFGVLEQPGCEVRRVEHGYGLDR